LIKIHSIILVLCFSKGFLIKLSQLSFNFLPPGADVFHNSIMLIHKLWALDQKGYYACFFVVDENG
jgi:hypothetical protein